MKSNAERLRRWLILHRQKVPDGSATAKAIDYSLKRWTPLTRYLDDGNLPIDNNPVTGATWSGRGTESAWIKGRDRQAFKVTITPSLRSALDGILDRRRRWRKRSRIPAAPPDSVAE